MQEVKITLAAARVNAGLTQEQAAREIGVSKKTLIGWEKGTAYPKPAMFDFMCRLYGMPKDAIFLP